MGFIDRLLGRSAPSVASPPIIVHASSGQTFNGLNDPALYEFIRNGGAAGITPKVALQTACVLRCVDLLSSSLAMLPMCLLRQGGREQATDHPLYNVLRYEPNNWQTAFEFVRLMELRRITRGNAFALIIRVGQRVAALQPLDPGTVTVEQGADWTMRYHLKRGDGQTVTLAAEDVLHLRDLSQDGLVGDSRTKLASEAIRVARAAERAQANIFANGMITGGSLSHPGKLGPEAYDRLRKAMEDRHSGTDNAGKWIVLEEGMKAERHTMTGQEAQTVEARNHQIEDVARAFGIPRPLLMMDDTSWGSGIEQLAMLFVRFGLNPGMVAWEQACRRSLLTREEKAKYEIDIDERELLRGTMKDQAEFFAKASGSGGHKPWLEANEIRDVTGYGPHENGGGLVPAGAEQGGGSAQ